MRLKKILCIISAALIFPLFAESKIIDFPILGFKTVPEEPIILGVEWNDEWFGEKSAFEYHHGIARIACVFAEISYIEDVDTHPKTNVIYRSYKALGISDDDMLFHYDINYDDPLGDNQSGVTFAHKTIMSAQGERTLVFCIVRGTPRNANEWISNVNISDSTHKAEDFHEGFFIAADQIYKELRAYLADKNINARDAFFLITGHSRGASVANMLGGIIANTDYLDTNKVYLYTFGTPNVTTESDCHSEKYGFIYNIEGIEDLCATLPPKRHQWNYMKYGKTLILTNRWSCDEETYENEYIPRMNVYFRKLLLRDYKPFRIGPFFPTQISRLFVILNRNVSRFYEGPLELRDKCIFTFHLVFPEKKKPKKKNTSLFGKAMFGLLNSATNGAFAYANVAVFDMHMCEAYLSWMLALSEDELFCDVPSSQIVFSGSFDAVISDSEGNAVITIKDGLSAFSAIKLPAAAMSLMGKTVVGLSGNEEYTVEILHDSLLPSPMSLKIEHYDGTGTYVESSERIWISPRAGQVFKFSAGKESAENLDIEPEIIKRRDASANVKHLPSMTSFLLSPSFSLGFSGGAEFGLDAGIRAVYASAFASRESFSAGIGTEANIFWRLYANEGIYIKWQDGDIFPSARALLSYKPFHSVRFFAAGVFDFAPNGFQSDFRFGLKL